MKNYWKCWECGIVTADPTDFGPGPDEGFDDKCVHCGAIDMCEDLGDHEDSCPNKEASFECECQNTGDIF